MDFVVWVVWSGVVLLWGSFSSLSSWSLFSHFPPSQPLFSSLSFFFPSSLFLIPRHREVTFVGWWWGSSVSFHRITSFTSPSYRELPSSLSDPRFPSHLLSSFFFLHGICADADADVLPTFPCWDDHLTSFLYVCMYICMCCPSYQSVQGQRKPSLIIHSIVLFLLSSPSSSSLPLTMYDLVLSVQDVLSVVGGRDIP